MARLGEQIPNEEWYLSISKKRNLPGHCPLASPDQCARYYLSLKVLQGAIETPLLSLSEKTQEELERKWSTSDCFANLDNSVGITPRAPGRSTGYSQVCPEVTGRLEGLYAYDLQPYADTFDQDQARKLLANDSNAKQSVRWHWNLCKPLHYVDCREFSIHGFGKLLATKKTNKRKSNSEVSDKLRWEIFRRDNFTCQYCYTKEADLQVDHVTSLADGGSNDPKNLITACRRCNGGKGRRSLEN